MIISDAWGSCVVLMNLNLYLNAVTTLRAKGRHNLKRYVNAAHEIKHAQRRKEDNAPKFYTPQKERARLRPSTYVPKALHCKLFGESYSRRNPEHVQ
jgi:hypothetical protein